MPDERYVLPPKEQAAKDRVYAYLSTNAAPIMDVLHTLGLKETYKKLTANPQIASMGKILWVVAIREIFDQTQPGDISPVGTWTSIDGMRMAAKTDIRMQVAEYVSDIWQTTGGDPTDCRIACNTFINEGLREIGSDDGQPHYLTDSMANMMEAAMEGLIVAHECFGDDGLKPDKERLNQALNANAEAYEPTGPWMKDDEDAVVSGSAKVVANFEKICADFRKEVADGEAD